MAVQKRMDGDGKFGLFDTLAISIGSMIAAGIFVLSGTAINFAGESALISISIAAALALLAGICLTELSSLVSKDGGIYEYTRAFNPSLGFASGVLRVASLLSLAAAIGMRSIFYINAFFMSGLPLLESIAIAITLLILGAMFVMSKFRFSVKIMLLLIALTVFEVAVAFVFGAGNVNAGDFMVAFDSSNYVDVLFSSGLFFLAFSGFAMLSRSRSRTRNSDKTIRKATLLSVLLLLIIYLTFAIMMISLIEKTSVGNVGSQLERSYLGSGWLMVLMSIVRILALFGVITLCFLTSSKTLQSMSENKDVLYSLKKLNHNRKPADSIVLCLFISLVLLLMVSTGLLLYFASSAMLLAFIIVEYSALKLSLKKRRDAKVKASLMGSKYFPIIPILGIFGNLLALFCLGFAPLIAAVIILVSSVLHFKFIRKRLPSKATKRNPIEVYGSSGEFTKE
jgi:basic amino acid/polyamine antiporter, APA family